MIPADRARFQDDMRAGIADNDATWLIRWLPEGCNAEQYLKRLKYRPGKGGIKVQWKADALAFVETAISNGVAESVAIERAAAKFKYCTDTLERYWREHKRTLTNTT